VCGFGAVELAAFPTSEFAKFEVAEITEKTHNGATESRRTHGGAVAPRHARHETDKTGEYKWH